MLFLYILWVVRLAVGIADESINSSLIISARCHIRCLNQLKNNDLPSSNDEMNDYTDGGNNLVYDDDVDDDDDDDDMEGGITKSSISLQHCKLNIQCAICSKPCNQVSLWENNCHSLCSNQEGCEESCRFVKEVVRIRGGVCPRETQAAGACTRTCISDADCVLSNHKCCSNGCGGWTCHPAAHIHQGMAEVVDQPLVHPLSPTQVRVTWSRPPNSPYPLLYILQSMTTDSKNLATQDWTYVTLTGDLWAEVDNLMFGYAYSFRVWSINIYGTKAPSLPSLTYTFSKPEPVKPDPPRNLTEGDSRIQQGSVSLDIHWLPPKSSHLPIARYKVLWREKEGRLREWRLVVVGSQHHATLNNLKPDTQYYVQVQAISEYAGVKLKSNRSAMFVSTYPLPRIQDRGYGSVAEEEQVSAVNELVVSQPFFHNGLLKANLSWAEERQEGGEGVSVTWQVEGCVHLDARSVHLFPHPITAFTHTKKYTIYDLRFGCKYAVVLGSGDGEKMIEFVETPTCDQVLVIGLVQPDCPHSGLETVDPVSNVQYKFIVGTSTVGLKLAWSGVSQSADVTSYVVTWMTTYQQIPNRSTLAFKQLPRDARMMTIFGLEGKRSYVICIQAHTRSTFGRIFSLHVTTPSTALSNDQISELFIDGFEMNAIPSSTSSQPPNNSSPRLANLNIHLKKEAANFVGSAYVLPSGPPTPVIEYHVLSTAHQLSSNQNHLKFSSLLQYFLLICVICIECFVR